MMIIMMKIKNNNGNTVKPVLSGYSKIDKAKVLITTGSLMVESIAECFNTFNLHKAIIGLKKQFQVFERGRFRRVLL